MLAFHLVFSFKQHHFRPRTPARVAAEARPIVVRVDVYVGVVIAHAGRTCGGCVCSQEEKERLRAPDECPVVRANVTSSRKGVASVRKSAKRPRFLFVKESQVSSRRRRSGHFESDGSRRAVRRPPSLASPKKEKVDRLAGLWGRGLTPSSSRGVFSLHAVAQHLIGGDEHDADDEGHGEGADETFPHARLPVLFLGMH